MGDPKESAKSGQDTSVFPAKDQPFDGQDAQTEQLDCDSSSFPSYNRNAPIRTAELVVDDEYLQSESFPCQPHQDAPFPLSPDNYEQGQIKPDGECLDANVTDGVKSEARVAIDSMIDAGEHSTVPISYVEGAEHHDRHPEPSTDSPDPTKHVIDGQADTSKVTADTKTEAHEAATDAKLEACELAAKAVTQIYEPVEDTKIEAYIPSAKTETCEMKDAKTETDEAAKDATHDLCQSTRNNCLPTLDAKTEASEVHKLLASEGPSTPNRGSYDVKNQIELRRELSNGVNITEISTPTNNGHSNSKHSFIFDKNYMIDGSESGTEEDQSAFMQELEKFFRERSMEFKPPKFYGEGLNCLKLWRAVMRLGGYDKVTSCKLWRQVGESFKPPKTCTTVSWTFRGFYEKALLDYERHKTQGCELSVSVSIATHSEPMNVDSQAAGSGRARRESATRAMQGWHSQRLLGNGEVSDPIIKDKNSISLQKREKQQKNLVGAGLLKRKKPSTYVENSAKAARVKTTKPQLDIAVVDVGPPADWVKINVQKTKDCFEIYALVPGLLREEVRVQSDPGGRLVISGEPEHTDNPWGVAPFKKVVSLPSRIDPHQTSAVVTLHGQLFVRVPFEQSE